MWLSSEIFVVIIFPRNLQKNLAELYKKYFSTVFFNLVTVLFLFGYFVSPVIKIQRPYTKSYITAII